MRVERVDEHAFIERTHTRRLGSGLVKASLSAAAQNENGFSATMLRRSAAAGPSRAASRHASASR